MRFIFTVLSVDKIKSLISLKEPYSVAGWIPNIVKTCLPVSSIVWVDGSPGIEAASFRVTPSVTLIFSGSTLPSSAARYRIFASLYGIQIKQLLIKYKNRQKFANNNNKKKLNYYKQECIPVGCVPPAAVAICCWGWCLPQCMLGYTPPRCWPGTPWVWARTPPSQTPQPPPGCGPRHPPARPPTSPLGLGLDTPTQPDPSTSPWVWA